MIEYHSISAKDRSRLHQCGEKVLPGIFLGYALYAWSFWKGDSFVADIEELEILDASVFRARRLNTKEVLTPQRGEDFIFPIADGTIKLSGREHGIRKSTSIQDYPKRGEERKDDLRGESDGSQPVDTMKDDSEVRNDFLSIEGNVTLNQELNSICQRKNHSQDHCDILTWSGEQTQPRMCCWTAV